MSMQELKDFPWGEVDLQETLPTRVIIITLLSSPRIFCIILGLELSAQYWAAGSPEESHLNSKCMKAKLFTRLGKKN